MGGIGARAKRGGISGSMGSGMTGRGGAGVKGGAGVMQGGGGLVVSKSERTYTNWREKRNELRTGLRAAREYEREKALARPAPHRVSSSSSRYGAGV